MSNKPVGGITDFGFNYKKDLVDLDDFVKKTDITDVVRDGDSYAIGSYLRDQPPNGGSYDSGTGSIIKWSKFTGMPAATISGKESNGTFIAPSDGYLIVETSEHLDERWDGSIYLPTPTSLYSLTIIRPKPGTTQHLFMKKGTKVYFRIQFLVNSATYYSSSDVDQQLHYWEFAFAPIEND